MTKWNTVIVFYKKMYDGYKNILVFCTLRQIDLHSMELFAFQVKLDFYVLACIASGGVVASLKSAPALASLAS